jgi:hypothetical protein
MPRKTDPALTRRAIGWVRRTRSRLAGSEAGATDWEQEFLDTLEERLDRYGSAFSDPDKGQLSAPLSLRQGLKLRQLSRKATPPPPPGDPSVDDAPVPDPGPQKRLFRAKSTQTSEPDGDKPRRTGLVRRTGLKTRAPWPRKPPR